MVEKVFPTRRRRAARRPRPQDKKEPALDVKHSIAPTPQTRHRNSARGATAAAIEQDRRRVWVVTAFAMLATIILLLALALPARAEIDRTAPAGIGAGRAVLAEAPPVARSTAANYLAGRFAQRRQDWNAAQVYMGEVARRDHDPMMMQRAFLLSLGAGRYAEAEQQAKFLDDKNTTADVAAIFMAAGALSAGKPDDALAQLSRLPENGFGDFTKPLMTAWAMAAKGDYAGADKLLAESPHADGALASYAFHRGLIAEMAGDPQAAAKAYLVTMREGLSLHSALVIAAFFDRMNAPHVSAKIHEGIDRMFVTAPALGQPAPLPAGTPSVRTAAEGAAYAVFDVASMLYERRAYDSAQIYASLTRMLSPQMTYASLMLGDIAALNGHYGQALDRYAAINEDTPLYWLSRLRVAEVHEAAGDMAAAAGVLGALAETPQTRLQSLVALGDIYRRQKDFEGARDAYDRALAAAPEKDARAPILFARGMAQSRLGDWTAAETDMLDGLKLQPDNAQALNFLGYSWLDRGEKTDEAFDLIRRAVALKPDDGYILDSYGWALYRQGDYAAAVTWLEKAVAAVPGDATILDHLGDAYWRAGRERDAHFQWQRGRELTSDTALRNGMDEKLRDGLAPVSTRAQLVRRDARI